MIDAVDAVIVSVWVAVFMSVLLSVSVVTDEKASEGVESIESLVADISVSLFSYSVLRLDDVFNSPVDEVVCIADGSVEDVTDEDGSSVTSSHCVAVESADTSTKNKAKLQT